MKGLGSGSIWEILHLDRIPPYPVFGISGLHSHWTHTNGSQVNDCRGSGEPGQPGGLLQGPAALREMPLGHPPTWFTAGPVVITVWDMGCSRLIISSSGLYLVGDVSEGKDLEAVRVRVRGQLGSGSLFH